jgi:hypothetical protein
MARTAALLPWIYLADVCNVMTRQLQLYVNPRRRARRE